ncbi:MAG: M18 family aminopeptidase [Eggerthellales bacterium]|nr:M18 family aminopeptidase [Eggerthellales bacterium]
MDQYTQGLMDFIQANPCNFFVVASQAAQLDAAGYVRLDESAEWNIVPGGKYYVTRNGSALVAFRVPVQVQPQAPLPFLIMASHSDAPTLRIKTNPEIVTAGAYTTLNVELYGGALLSTWFDRPLSAAGRLMVRTPEGPQMRLVNLDRDLMVIPSLAIHQNRKSNSGYEYNVQKDLLPLFGNGQAGRILTLAAEAVGVAEEDVLAHELVLYPRMAPCVWGASEEFISAPHLDDVQCAYASLTGFLEAGAANAADPFIPVHVVFDNEEVGSGTKQGAASTFLRDTLERLAEALGCSPAQYKRALAASFMLSGDNGHALHPNYQEKCDPTNRPVLGGGVLIKHAANQKYTTDAASEAIVRTLAEQAGVPVQDFVNRSDEPGGSTLGNLSSAQVAVATADVGVAQLAMHSSYETCSAADTAHLVALARQLFSGSALADIRAALC